VGDIAVDGLRLSDALRHTTLPCPGGRLFFSEVTARAHPEYTADGKRVKCGERGSGPGQFQIPHGIANDGKFCTSPTAAMRACSVSISTAATWASDTPGQAICAEATAGLVG